MVRSGELRCPYCGGELKYYDKVRRIVRTKQRKTGYITVKRFKCIDCDHVHRAIPQFIFPYKQYEAEIIQGVLDGTITSSTLGFEDYPCEMTMNRWKSQKIQVMKD